MKELMKLDNIAPNNGTLGSLTHFLSEDAPEYPTYPAPSGNYKVCDFPSLDEAARRRNSSDCLCQDMQVIHMTLS